MDNALQSLALVAAAVGIAASVYQLIRSSWEQRVAIGNSFRSVVDGLTSTDQVQRLGSAILLRRFFNADSEFARRRLLRRTKRLPYADDAIDVIAATLRAEPTGFVQTTLGDGLAYAPGGDLRGRDFRSTNLRDAYLSLEGPAGHGVRKQDRRLDLSDADFFRAKLAEASFKKSTCENTTFYEADARSAVFRECILHGANFSAANLRHADFRKAEAERASFRDADLGHAVFAGAILKDADFTGAREIPPEIAAHLDENSKFRSPERVEASPPVAPAESGAPNFFMSVPNTGPHEIPDLIQDALAENGARPFGVIRITRDQYHDHRHLAEIREAIRGCAGVIVVGLPQLEVVRGVWRADSEEEVDLVDEGLATPWNDIEAGVAVGLNVPVLAVRVGARPQGIFGLSRQNAGFELLELDDEWSESELRQSIRTWAMGVAR